MLRSLRISAPAARILPFAVYLGFLALELAVSHWVGAESKTAALDTRWIYPVKTLCTGLVLLLVLRQCTELTRPQRLAFGETVMAVTVGVVVWVVWIGVDQAWATVGTPQGYDPRRADGSIDWPLAGVRLMGAAVVVPLIEELFWRSFLMRWTVDRDFLRVSPRAVTPFAFMATAIVFGLEHHQWFAGIVAGVAYASLYVRTGQLWQSVIAHAVTNGLLGVWVLYTGAWEYW